MHQMTPAAHLILSISNRIYYSHDFISAPDHHCDGSI